LLVDKLKELPTEIKNWVFTVDEETYNFTGTVELLVIRAYWRLLVVNVPAPGVALKLNIEV
jgi:hypothetical protein